MTQLMSSVPYAPAIAVKQLDKEKNLDSLNYEEGMEQKRAGRIETLKIILPDIFAMMKSGKSDKKDKYVNIGSQNGYYTTDEARAYCHTYLNAIKDKIVDEFELN